MLARHLSGLGIHWGLQALLGALLLGGLGPIAIDMDGILPLSLQSLLVCWIPLMLGARAGLIAVLVYLAAGAMGLPVFADHRSGLDVIAGPTGGYLLGFPIAAFLLGLLVDRVKTRSLRHQYGLVALGMVAGHAVILTFGLPWQMRFDTTLDVAALLERLARPIALKSAIGTLLSVVALRGLQGRA